MSCKEEFIEIFKENVTRPGADAMLDYLTNKCDFFTAPASARYHGAHEGGLCEHSLNVYYCLKEYLARERVQELYGLHYSDETIAIVSLLHDLCKIGCYTPGVRNVKGPDGKWTQVPTYNFNEAFGVSATDYRNVTVDAYYKNGVYNCLDFDLVEIDDSWYLVRTW